MNKKEIGIVFLRISMGLMITGHGIMKILGGMEFMHKLGSLPLFVPEWPAIYPVLGILATAIELLGGILVMAGHFTRTASIAIAVVLFAGFTVHMPNISDFSSLMRNTWPFEIMLAFIVISIIGPGEWRLRFKKKH